MRFKQFIEAINRDKARAIVFDAIGADGTEEENDVLGSMIRHHPDLPEKIGKYTELAPYASQIEGFIYASENKTIQQLIDYIEKLDNTPNDIDQPTDLPDNLGGKQFGSPG